MNRRAFLAALAMGLVYWLAMKLMPTASDLLRFAMLTAFLYIALTTANYLPTPALQQVLRERLPSKPAEEK